MLTFLFTDIADSTRLWQAFPKEMSRAQAAHDEILRSLLRQHQGQIVKSTGDGVHATFERVNDAAQTAVAVQRELINYPWQLDERLQVRMGLHTGDADYRDGDFYGTTVNTAARIMDLAAGGQVLLSDVTVALIEQQPGLEFSFQQLGSYRLKGLSGRMGIHQLQHPALPADFPPLRGGEAVPNNLPTDMTSFIGREREIARIVSCLVDTESDASRQRLVTLIGPGGTGKTRLSIQAARAVREAFPDGVWLVELAPLADPELIPTAVLKSLQLQESPSTPALKLIGSYLREKQALLIFDNCEHLIDASARVINEILQAAPLVQVLASSREALGVYGETILRIQSLPLPESDQAAWEEVQKSEAVQLFVARGETANGRRWLTAENGPAIAQICRRLDGIPLAIEMAAARLRVFSPAQILARLDDRFRLLTGGSRTALPRLQTLQALIDWSYELLSEEEKGLFQELSVFAGGWTFEMALDVCPDWDVYSILPQLVDKSLVVAEPQGEGMRYRFLETMRQYARDRLMESGRAPEVRNRHLAFFVAYSKPGDVYSVSSTQAFLIRMEPDVENCRTALTWGLNEDPLSALTMASNLTNFWANGLVLEGLDWIDAALEKVLALQEEGAYGGGEDELNRVLARGYIARSSLLYPTGHNELAFEAASKGRALIEPLGDEFELMIANALYGLGGIWLGKAEPTLEAIETSLALAKEYPDPFPYALTLNLKGLAKIYLEQDIAAARELLEESIAIEPIIGTHSISGVFVLIKIQTMSKNWDRAREVIDLALRAIAESPYTVNKRQLNSYHAERGHVERQSGNLEAALNIYGPLIVSYRELSMEPAVANLLECYGMIAVEKGQLKRAGRLFGAAEALRERIQADMTPYERMEYEAVLSRYRSAAEPKVLEKAWRSGRSMTMDQAIEFALQYAEFEVGSGD